MVCRKETQNTEYVKPWGRWATVRQEDEYEATVGTDSTELDTLEKYHAMFLQLLTVQLFPHSNASDMVGCLYICMNKQVCSCSE